MRLPVAHEKKAHAHPSACAYRSVHAHRSARAIVQHVRIARRVRITLICALHGASPSLAACASSAHLHSSPHAPDKEHMPGNARSGVLALKSANAELGDAHGCDACVSYIM